jgi:uncharacterized protein (TIGR02147 family)
MHIPSISHKNVENIESYEDYKALLKAMVQNNSHIRGYCSRLAEAASCHPSFISQILNSPIHLTPDHGAGIAAFWNLSQSQTEYFLCLIQLARAATPALRNSLQQTLRELRNKRLQLDLRLSQPKIGSEHAESLYYSSWVWSAVHVLSSIPKFRSEKAIAERLNLSPKQVSETLHRLSGMNLVRKKGGSWEIQESLHLPRGSQMIVQHLQNWRQRATLSAGDPNPENIHYSAVHSVSRADLEKLRQMVLNFLEHTRDVIRPSPEEELICINLDLFTV